MEMMKMEMMVPKEAAEMGMAFGKIAKEIKKMAADGVSAADIPAAIAALMSPELAAGVMGIDKLPEELKADKAAFVMAIGAGFMHSFSME